MLFRGRLISRPAAEHHGGPAIKWHGFTLAMKNKKVPQKVRLSPEVVMLLRHSYALSQTTKKVLRGK